MSWAPDYTTLALVKKRLGVEESDTTDDVDISLAITAASRAIDDYCNRQFGRVSSLEERFYTAQYNYRRGRMVVLLDDLMPPVTGSAEITVTTADGEITDYTLEPKNAPADGMPYTRLVVNATSTIQPDCEENGVSVESDSFGWTAIPAGVQLAALIQSHRFANRKDSPYGIEGSPDTDGGELRILAKLDPDVKISLKKYVRPRRLY